MSQTEITESLFDYALEKSTEESPVLKELYRETNLKVIRPRMISGTLQGNLLKMLSRMFKPKTILEIGTYTGYSAICLSQGLLEGGVLHTIEINQELEDIINKYIRKSEINDKVKLHIGRALDIIPTIDSEFDMVFIDADKENYLNYYKLVFDKVKKGGVIIADNVLWDGKVLNEPLAKDKETKGIIKFNDFIKNDDRVTNVLLPVRDGLMIIMKK